MPEAGTETRSPVEEAAAALTRAGRPREKKIDSVGKPDQTTKNTPSAQAAAEGADAEQTSRKEWTAEQTQVARHMLDRYKAPNAKAEDLSDADIEFGLSLSSMQEGMDAKAKRLEADREALKAELAESQKSSDRKSDEARKADDFKDAESMLTKAIEDSDPNQIGPALEKLRASLALKQEAQPATVGAQSAEVEDMLVESARTQLEQDWPALRNGGIFDEVADLAEGLKGKDRYANMRSAEARIARLRDASTLVLGAPDSKQTQTRPPGSSAPRPNGHPEPVDKTPKDPLSIARRVLNDRGLR